MAKIIIMADSVAEARADLEMIEKAKSIGAISGSGSSKDGTMSLEMPMVRGIMAEAYADRCPCGHSCCDEPREMSLEDAMAMLYYGYLD